MKVDLTRYNMAGYTPGVNIFKQILWYYVNAFLFNSSWFPFSRAKVMLLRWFGATIITGITIKPRVNIKYPWFLKIGNHVWIGEGVWIDNLQQVEIGDNVCLSQGAMLLTGNHNYSKTTFDLIVKGIILEEGVWIGTKAIVCPGVKCRSHSVLSVMSVATRDMVAYGVYQGNPAVGIRTREITE